MKNEDLPLWISILSDDDLVFIKRFLLASGSLKELAKQYNITYPTIRLRLDRLIEKIKTGDNENHDDEYILLIKRMAIDKKIEFESAKELIKTYRKLKESE